jgi:hypothetical protein
MIITRSFALLKPSDTSKTTIGNAIHHTYDTFGLMVSLGFKIAAPIIKISDMRCRNHLASPKNRNLIFSDPLHFQLHDAKSLRGMDDQAVRQGCHKTVGGATSGT